MAEASTATLEPALTDALNAQSEALNLVPSPVGSAVRLLEQADVEHALNSMPVQWRRHLLGALRIPVVGTRVSPALCRDVLARMKRDPDSSKARHASAHLTQPLLNDLLMAGVSSDSLTRRWSPALLRLAVWSLLQVSTEDAPLWLWALDQPWTTDTFPPEAIAVVREATERLVELLPSPGEACELEPAPMEAEGRSAVPPAVVVADQQEQEQEQEQEVAPGAETLTAGLDRVEQALGEAVEPVRRIAKAVSEQARPDDADMARLIELTAAFDETLARLRRHGEAPIRTDLLSLRERTTAVITMLDIGQLRVSLERVDRLVRTPDTTLPVETLTEAQGRAQALRSREVWGDQDRADAEALDILLTMVDLAQGSHDRPAEMLELLRKMSAKAPAPGLVMLAAQHAGLALAPYGVTEDSEYERDSASPETPVAVVPADPPAVHHGASTPVMGRTMVVPMPAGPAVHATAPAAASVDAPQPERPVQPSAFRTAPIPPQPSGEAEAAPNAGVVGSRTVDVAPVEEVPTRDVFSLGTPSTALLAPLIEAQRYGAAAALAHQNGEPGFRVSALRISAYAHAMRSASGECASRVRAELLETAVEELVDSKPDAALVTAALLRIVLVTGDPEASAPLEQVASALPPSLVSIAGEVSKRALQSMLLHSPPLALARGAAELEKTMQEAREECRQGLDHIPRLRFNRATEITRLWLAPAGLIGVLLSSAAADDRTAVDKVAERVRELSVDSNLQAELDEIDRRLMKSSRSRLEGPVRQSLLRLMNDRLRTVENWVAAARALNAGAANWSVDQVQEMRVNVLALQDSVLGDLEEQDFAQDQYAAMAMKAAVESLHLTFQLLAGDARLHPAEPPAEIVLGADLLKLTDVRVDDATGQIVPPRLTIEDIAVAADTTWGEAVHGHAVAERFDITTHLFELSERGHLPGPGGGGELIPARLHMTVSQMAKRTVAELEDKRRILEDTLRRTRVNGVFREEEERDFEHRLQACALTTTADLALARRRLNGMSEELERAHATATAKLRARLVEIPDLKPENVARVTPLLDDGDLLTAEELISHLSNGESIPDTRQASHPLDAFFPAVPEALPNGITEEFVQAVRDRRRFRDLDVLDFSTMSAEFTEQAAQGLSGWREMASRRGSRRLEGLSEENLLMPALHLIGYRSLRKPQRDRQRSTTAEHRFLDVNEVRYTGEALVPAFGSGLRGRLRVMLAWGQPTAGALMARVQQDPSQDSLLVAYFGTLSAEDRTALAVLSVGRRPMLVLDDAALAYLAARGNQLLDPAMRVLLPFSAVNPYVSEKRGRVAEEMFFGRLEELGSVQNPAGNQVVFGGRGLGKSALLKEAGRKFTAQAPMSHISLALSLDSTYNGTSAQPSTVWNIIGRRLLEEDALPLPKRVRADTTLTYDNVLTGIRAWLKADTSRRMLIMLDEADGFFESDSPRFTETRRLRDLSAETNDGVKIVFAGLHSVQRYATLAVNNPFSHLSQHPTVIGPLQPQDAANLLLKPLAALGYRFSEPSLVHRILGHCSYQPFLLQMFAHRLVQVMHGRRTEESSGPLYSIARADVERVQSDRNLRRSITAAFHDTLRLDSRYNMIANVVAHHAHHHGIDARMTHAELRDECTYWWAEGFRDLDPDQFRAYLTEMEGLGVLAPDPDQRGWHLRSANALSMIGTLEEVDAQLQNTSSRELTERLTAMETRHQSRDSHSHCPLTAAQIADILPGRQVSGTEKGRRNLARVVIGSPATGINRVSSALREIAESTGWKMPHVNRRADFERELVSGEAGTSRLVVSDLTVKSPGEQSCLESPDLAVTRLPEGPGVTRSAVVVAGLGQMSLWTTLLSGEGAREADVVPLRRFTRHGLRTWALDQGAFTSEAALERLGTTTGGWPLLVDRLAEEMARRRLESAALRVVSERLESDEGASEFLSQVGLVPQTLLWSAFAVILELMPEEGLASEDLEAAVETGISGMGLTAGEAVRALRALQVFDVTADGLHHPEAVVFDCWSRVSPV
ncbi:hypothetical protein [Streptomyces sp. A 4/2]|uniref:hypothetical protein n=1 Tax=Streptomyces sp. A 4/2 TaxID=2934314 RepID=UPI0020246742|nr:hypothetical protein [Streptomyces sp. A 4/2]